MSSKLFRSISHCLAFSRRFYCYVRCLLNIGFCLDVETDPSTLGHNEVLLHFIFFCNSDRTFIGKPMSSNLAPCMCPSSRCPSGTQFHRNDVDWQLPPTTIRPWFELLLRLELPSSSSSLVHRNARNVCVCAFRKRETMNTQIHKLAQRKCRKNDDDLLFGFRQHCRP